MPEYMRYDVLDLGVTLRHCVFAVKKKNSTSFNYNINNSNPQPHTSRHAPYHSLRRCLQPLQFLRAIRFKTRSKKTVSLRLLARKIRTGSVRQTPATRQYIQLIYSVRRRYDLQQIYRRITHVEISRRTMVAHVCIYPGACCDQRWCI